MISVASVAGSSTDDIGLIRLKFCPFCLSFYEEKLETEEHIKKCPFKSAFMYRIGNKYLSQALPEAGNSQFNFFFILF